MSKNDKHALLIFGAGKVGIAIGHILGKKRFPITGAVAQSNQSLDNIAKYIPQTKPIKSINTAGIKKASSSAKIIFITTNDGQIKPSCERLVRNGMIDKSHIVVHMSGAIGLDALKTAAEIGAGVASIHPIQSFAEIEPAIDKLAGSFFGVTTSNDINTRKTALSIIEELDGIPIDIIDENKPIYHAASCAASNYLVSLIDLAKQLLNAVGFPDDLAIEAIIPLVKGTVSNIEALGTKQALTGPISRGDVDTVSRHINQLTLLAKSNFTITGAVDRDDHKEHGVGPGRLENTDAGLEHSIVDGYKTLGLLTIVLALQKGTIDQNTADKMALLLYNGDIKQNG